MPPPEGIKNTRERILAYLDENPIASAQSLSRAWGLTRADIRYHLTALAQEGLIELVPRQPGMAAPRGRPVQYYRRALASASHNLGGLCRALLIVIEETLPAQEREAALRMVAGQLAGDFEPPESPVRRMNETVRFLARHGYHARWEASARGPRVLLRGCPYAALLADHPEICQIERYFLEKLTGLNLRQDARQNLVTGKPPACVFYPEWVRT